MSRPIQGVLFDIGHQDDAVRERETRIRADVRSAIRTFAVTGRCFSADDVADNVAGQAGLDGVMAAEFSRAARIGLIRRVSTTDSRRHASLLRTWRGTNRSVRAATVF